MPDDLSRRALHAYVSDEAHDQWHGFAAEQGVSVSAILEALAPELNRESDLVEPISERLDNVVRSARRIDAARRRRRRS